MSSNSGNKSDPKVVIIQQGYRRPKRRSHGKTTWGRFIIKLIRLFNL